MKFMLTCTQTIFEEGEANKRILESLDFVFENPQVDNGCIKYYLDSEDQHIYIDLNTIEELWAFVVKYGKIVVMKNDRTGESEIEIYNDYRE